MNDLEARILPLLSKLPSGRHCLGIAIEREQPPTLPERLKHPPAVASPTESRIDIDPFGPDPQRLDCFARQDRHMLVLG